MGPLNPLGAFLDLTLPALPRKLQHAAHPAHRLHVPCQTLGPYADRENTPAEGQVGAAHLPKARMAHVRPPDTAHLPKARMAVIRPPIPARTMQVVHMGMPAKRCVEQNPRYRWQISQNAHVHLPKQRVHVRDIASFELLARHTNF